MIRFGKERLLSMGLSIFCWKFFYDNQVEISIRHLDRKRKSMGSISRLESCQRNCVDWEGCQDQLWKCTSPWAMRTRWEGQEEGQGSGRGAARSGARAPKEAEISLVRRCNTENIFLSIHRLPQWNNLKYSLRVYLSGITNFTRDCPHLQRPWAWERCAH